MRPASSPARTRVRRMVGAAIACLLALGLLILLSWMEVTFTSPESCAQMTCQDISLFPLFIGPWLLLAAIVLLVMAFVTARAARRRGSEPAAATAPSAAAESSSNTVPVSQLGAPGLRIVGGLIDALILLLIDSLISGVTGALGQGLLGAGIALLVDLSYLSYFWSVRGQSPGMMPFGLKVRSATTMQYPSLGTSIVRAFAWLLEIFLTSLGIGAIGWLWLLRDGRQQAVHDKVAGTVVTTGEA